jgi:hypothetical protein
MPTDSFKDSPEPVSPGVDEDLFNARFAATRREGVPVEKTTALWRKSQKKAECAVNQQGLGTGGASAAIGTRLQVDGNPSQDLQLTVDPNWKGIISNKGFGSATLQFQTLATRGSAPLFPDVGSSSILDRQEHVDLSRGASLTPKVVSGAKTIDLLVPSSELSDGDIVRVAVGADVTATVTKVLGQGRADAASNVEGNYDGRIFFGSVQASWR